MQTKNGCTCVPSREVSIKEVTLIRHWNETSCSSEQSKYLPAKEGLYLLLRFYDIYIYYYYIHINRLALCSGSPAGLISIPWMTNQFEDEKDIIKYALKKTISFARNNQYIYVAQCVWWKVSIIGLQEGLVTHINNLKMWSNTGIWGVSSTLRNLPDDLRIGRQQKRLIEPLPIIIQSSMDYIHPNRITKIAGNPDYTNNLDQSSIASTGFIDSEIEWQDTVIKETTDFIQHWRKDCRAFTQEKRKLAALHKFRSGKVAFKPSNKTQKNQLNAISTNS